MLIAKVGVVSEVRLFVEEVPVSLAAIRSGAPTIGETVTEKVDVVVMAPSNTEMVMMVVPVLPVTAVIARLFAAFAAPVVEVEPVPPVRTNPEFATRAVLLLVIV
jgi:hypothetical protein